MSPGPLLLAGVKLGAGVLEAPTIVPRTGVCLQGCVFIPQPLSSTHLAFPLILKYFPEYSYREPPTQQSHRGPALFSKINYQNGQSLSPKATSSRRPRCVETPVAALTQDLRTRGQDMDGAGQRQLQITHRVSGQRCGGLQCSGPGASMVLRPLVFVCGVGLLGCTGCTGCPESRQMPFSGLPLPLDMRTRPPGS